VERGGAAAPFSLTFGQCPMWFVSYVVVSLHIWHLGTSLVRNSDVGPLFSFDSCFVFSRVNVFVNGCFILLLHVLQNPSIGFLYMCFINSSVIYARCNLLMLLYL
jgi:hypothetical protein